MTKTAQQLTDRLLDLIRDESTPSCGREQGPRLQEQTFDALALDIFGFQFAHNAPYRAFCIQQRATPDSADHWTKIPAVPTSAFKHFAITCFPVAEAVAEFHTSGTTRQLAGKHWFKTLDLYNAALRPQFAAHLLPDNARLPMVILTPSPANAPHSSLVHMLGEVASDYATGATFHDADMEGAIARLQTLAGQGEPVAVLGTAFSFVNLFDFMRERGVQLHLPSGSRAMETGGFKGRTREVAKPDLYAMFADHLGIPPSRVVNEYGMTELSTQFYDQTLRVGYQSDHKSVPPWARVQVIDPRTGHASGKGDRGLIRILDLANLWSACCIQTEDIGICFDDGFEILGRSTSAEARGCSLIADPGAGHQ
jgi:hypothetical protein